MLLILIIFTPIKLLKFNEDKELHCSNIKLISILEILLFIFINLINSNFLQLENALLKLVIEYKFTPDKSIDIN